MEQCGLRYVVSRLYERRVPVWLAEVKEIPLGEIKEEDEGRIGGAVLGRYRQPCTELPPAFCAAVAGAAVCGARLAPCQERAGKRGTGTVQRCRGDGLGAARYFTGAAAC